MRVDNGVLLKGIVFFLVIYSVNVVFIWFVTSDYFSLFISISEFPLFEPGDLKEKPALIVTAVVGSIDGLLGALTWFVPGYYAGRSVKQNGLLHGAFIGALGFCIAFLVMSALPDLGFEDNRNLFGFLYNAVGIAFLCSLAGGVGELHASKGLKA